MRHWVDVDHRGRARDHGQGFKGRAQLGGLAAGLVQVIVLRTCIDDPDAHRTGVAADVDSEGPVCAHSTGAEQGFCAIAGNAVDIDPQIVAGDHIASFDDTLDKATVVGLGDFGCACLST